MVIAIDLDKTIIDCKSKIYQLANKFQPKRKSSNYLKYSIVCKDLVKKNDGKPIIKTLGKISDLTCYSEIQNSALIINKWTKRGFKIVLLSCRPNIRILSSMMVSLLEKINVPFTFIVLACNDKAKFCKMFGVDIIVDDSFSNCIRCDSVGTMPILFQENMSKKKEKQYSNYGISTAKSWIGVNDLVNEYVEELQNIDLSYDNKFDDNDYDYDNYEFGKYRFCDSEFDDSAPLNEKELS